MLRGQWFTEEGGGILGEGEDTPSQQKPNEITIEGDKTEHVYGRDPVW